MTISNYDEESRSKEEARLNYIKRSDEIASLIGAIPECRYNCDVQFTDLNWHIERYRKNYDGFDENPDFQRGYVWTEEQQIKYIESFIRGAVGDTARTITLNCPDFQRDKDKKSDLTGFVVVDGLQRLTAVRRFMNDEIRVFNDAVSGGCDYDFFNYSRFNLKSSNGLKFNILNLQTKKEVIDYYIAFNDGGTAHTKEEIDRVREIRNNL